MEDIVYSVFFAQMSMHKYVYLQNTRFCFMSKYVYFGDINVKHDCLLFRITLHTVDKLYRYVSHLLSKRLVSMLFNVRQLIIRWPVLTLIQRRYIEQVKVALPVVLKVMHAAVSECVEEHGSAAVDLFNAAHGIGNTIQEMCKSMVC